MKLATCFVESLDVSVHFPPAELPGTYARFGDEVVIQVTDSVWEPLSESAETAGIVLRELSGPFTKKELYLVIQVGDSFRRENPGATVILNKGRYLAVLLKPEDARDLRSEQSCGFAVRPLKGRETVFDIRPPAAPPAKPEQWARDLVASISRLSIEAVVRHLASFPTRHSTSRHYAAAAAWAKDRLDALGYRTRLTAVMVDGDKSFNVVAEKPGYGASGRDLVVVTAHLDSINIAGGPSAPAPGADDNGSGSAGLLEIARVLKGHAGRNDLRLILFGGEEEGLRGSQQYVAALSGADRARIKAVVNMDMIATVNTPAGFAVLLEGAPVSRQVIEWQAAAAAAHTHLTVQTSLHAARSDHVPFILAGLPAVLTIEGTAGENHNIHSDRDTLAHLNYDLLLEILRMNVAFVAGAVGR